YLTPSDTIDLNSNTFNTIKYIKNIISGSGNDLKIVLHITFIELSVYLIFKLIEAPIIIPNKVEIAKVGINNIIVFLKYNLSSSHTKFPSKLTPKEPLNKIL